MAYTTTLSVLQGGNAVVCDAAATAPKTRYVRVVRVDDLQKAPFRPSGRTKVWPPSDPYVQVTVGVKATPWNGEEYGYGWDPLPGVTITTDTTWPPGLYSAQLLDVVPAAESDWDGAEDVYFLVRAATPTSGAQILLCWPWSTTVAYAGGGPNIYKSLYDSPSPGRLRRVSLDRPLQSFPWGDERINTHWAPFRLWKFIVSLNAGYIVDHCTSFDLHAEANILDPYMLFVSVGHDEYWSKEMRDRVEAHVRAGKNAAFFSANSVWWQVRFENSNKTMVCYKSGADDRAASNLVSANFASTPPESATSWPENSTTGVSFRRGSIVGDLGPVPDDKYKVIADPTTEPDFLDGADGAIAQGTRFPNDSAANPVFGLETDACEVNDASSGDYRPTGNDGTPGTLATPNFKVLAYADLTGSTMRMRGAAVVGYFKDVGTCFTTGTTHWASALDDAIVAKLTKYALRTLTAAFTGSAWSRPAREYPTASWEAISGTAMSNARAVCGVVQGHLLYMADGLAAARRKHPELKSLVWTATQVPTLGSVLGLAGDVYGTHLYGAKLSILGEPTLYWRDGLVTSNAAWQAISGEPGFVETVAATNMLFAAVKISGTDRFLYAVSSPPPHVPVSFTWTKIGRTTRVVGAMAGWDGNIFAATTDWKLLCRQTTLADLVWAEIGTVPASTFALTAYYGRLYCLAGTASAPLLYWRTAVAAGGIDPTIVFINKNTNAFAVGRMSGDGKYENVALPSVASFPQTHVVRAGRNLVFRYDSSSRGGQLLRVNGDGSVTQLHVWASGSFGAWTHIVAIITPGQPDKVLFYNTSSGASVIGVFQETSPFFINEWSATLSASWSLITCTWNGDIIFYRASNGSFVWCRYTTGSFTNVGSGTLATGQEELVPIGSSSFLLRKKSPTTEDVRDVWGAVCTQRISGTTTFANYDRVVAAANGVVLGYAPTTSKTYAIRIGPTATGGANLFLELRNYQNGFTSGWTDFIALGMVV